MAALLHGYRKRGARLAVFARGRTATADMLGVIRGMTGRSGCDAAHIPRARTN